jgi:hypothetical protein
VTETLLLDHGEIESQHQQPRGRCYTESRRPLWCPSNTAVLSTFGAVGGGQVSPNRKCSLNLFEEGGPLLDGGVIHIVVGEVVAANGVARH